MFLQIFFQETSNMEDRTQVLVNRIWQKMNNIDDAINEKSNMLFEIRDELVTLFEKAKKTYNLN